MTFQQIIAELFKTEHEQFLYYKKTNQSEYKKLYTSCHVPSIRYTIDDVFDKIIKNSNQDLIDDLLKQFKTKKYLNLFKNTQTIYLVTFVIVYAKNKQEEKAKEFAFTLALKFYASLFYNKYFKYCNDNRFEIALARVSHSHLYKVKRGIAPALKHMSDTSYNRWKDKIDFNNPDDIVKWVYEIRHRINQSMKAFANVYYAVPDGMASDTVSAEDAIDVKHLTIQKIINDYLNKYQILKMFNENVLKNINSKYNLNYGKLLNVFKEMQDTDYGDELTHIISILINNRNVNKMKDLFEWQGEIKKFLGQKIKSKLNVRVLIAKLLIQLESFKTTFLQKGDITRRRVVNVVIVYFMLEIRGMLFK